MEHAPPPSRSSSRRILLVGATTFVAAYFVAGLFEVLVRRIAPDNWIGFLLRGTPLAVASVYGNDIVSFFLSDNSQVSPSVFVWGFLLGYGACLALHAF